RMARSWQPDGQKIKKAVSGKSSVVFFFCLFKRKKHPAAWPAASPALHGKKPHPHNNEDRLVEV
ncbi:MAG: hypothetical protein B5M56_10150, partial [Desulfococcus sp. 4484_241]